MTSLTDALSGSIHGLGSVSNMLGRPRAQFPECWHTSGSKLIVTSPPIYDFLAMTLVVDVRSPSILPRSELSVHGELPNAAPLHGSMKGLGSRGTMEAMFERRWSRSGAGKITTPSQPQRSRRRRLRLGVFVIAVVSAIGYADGAVWSSSWGIPGALVGMLLSALAIVLISHWEESARPT